MSKPQDDPEMRLSVGCATADATSRDWGRHYATTATGKVDFRMIVWPTHRIMSNYPRLFRLQLKNYGNFELWTRNGHQSIFMSRFCRLLSRFRRLLSRLVALHVGGDFSKKRRNFEKVNRHFFASIDAFEDWLLRFCAPCTKKPKTLCGVLTWKMLILSLGQKKCWKSMVRGEFEKIIPELSISKVVVGGHHFAEACTTSFPVIQPQNEPLLFTNFGTEGINNSLTIYSIMN